MFQNCFSFCFSFRSIRLSKRFNISLHNFFKSLQFVTRFSMWYRRFFTRLTVPLSATGYLALMKSDCKRPELVQAKSTSPAKVASSERKDPKFRRFYNFATIQINGQYYMTPSDFLESVTEATPRKSAYRLSKILPLPYKCVRNLT